MKEIGIELIKEIVPIILTVVVVPILLKVKTIVVNYIKAKVNEDILEKSKEVWQIVDEKFRITEKIEDITETKAQMFDRLLLKKFPSLTEEDLEYWRQTVAGAVNANKEKKLSTDDYINKIKQLENENAELKKNADSVLKEKITNVLNNAEI